MNNLESVPFHENVLLVAGARNNLTIHLYRDATGQGEVDHQLRNCERIRDLAQLAINRQSHRADVLA